MFMHHLVLMVCFRFIQQRNPQQSSTPSRHASAPVAPPQTLLHRPLPPHPRTQATQTPAERGGGGRGGSKGSRKGPLGVSLPTKWTELAVELLTMEPQDGSDETSTRQNWSDPTSVKPRKRDGAFPCAQLIHPILSWTQKR